MTVDLLTAEDVLEWASEAHEIIEVREPLFVGQRQIVAPGAHEIAARIAENERLRRAFEEFDITAFHARHPFIVEEQCKECAQRDVLEELHEAMKGVNKFTCARKITG